MRRDTGRPDIGFDNVFIDTSSRQYFISPNFRKEIVRPEMAKMEDILEDVKSLQEQVNKILAAILVVVASGQNLSGNEEDY